MTTELESLFASHLQVRVDRIAALQEDEHHAEDLDDRIGIRKRLWDEERYLGRWVYENRHNLGLSR